MVWNLEIGISIANVFAYNIGHMAMLERYHRIDIISGTYKPDTRLPIYIGIIWNHGFNQ